MQLGIVGLGRMGANMTRRLTRGGHDCVVFDADPLGAALTGRFASRGEDDFADKVLSALRHQFGGHAEKKS